MTEMEMLDEAKNQWEEVKKIIDTFVIKAPNEVEELLRKAYDFYDIRENIRDSVYDFCYKNLDLRVTLNKENKLELDSIVTYWDSSYYEVINLKENEND